LIVQTGAKLASTAGNACWAVRWTAALPTPCAHCNRLVLFTLPLGNWRIGWYTPGTGFWNADPARQEISGGYVRYRRLPFPGYAAGLLTLVDIAARPVGFILTQAAPATKYGDAVRSRPLALGARPRRSVALQMTRKHTRITRTSSAV